VPEGDTIAYAARRMRPVLEGFVPDAIRTPHPRHAFDRWPARLGGRAVTEIRTHGKHLFIAFDGGLVLHSHLRMTGAWGVYTPAARWGRSPRRAWLVLEHDGHQVVEFDGPVLELLTEGRARSDQRLAALGPDVLADPFDFERFLARLRADDPTRGIGDALLDQRNLAGIGNIWKAEGCWEAAIDPWRRVGDVTEAEARSIIELVRPRMLESAATGRMGDEPRAYRRAGRLCPRCGGPIRAHGQGDDNRTTFWCPGCQR
jgi:endonuclease VIII